MTTTSSEDANLRLIELLRSGLARADSLQRRQVRLAAYPAADQEELVTLLHAYLWDTAAPYDKDWYRSPGNIMTLWAELLEAEEPTRARLRPLRTDLVKALSTRGLVLRTHPRSAPILVREIFGTIMPPVHRGDAREAYSSIAFGPWGAGYGDADRNRQVEVAAEEFVTRHYEQAGWTVHRVAHLKCGWDLTATDGITEVHLEVKGVSSSMPSVLLTRNELRSAQIDPIWRLVVVTTALTSPAFSEFGADAVVAAADPTVYRVNLSP
jgi:uncharacterized protein DUF3883